MARLLAIGLALLWLAACGGTDDVISHDGPWPSAEERTLAEGMAPTPFTAAQIRAACPAGRRSTYRVESAGRTPFLQVTHFLSSDAEGAQVESSMTELDGTRLGGTRRSRSTWSEFQAHASFPADATEVSEVVVEVPAGRYACWRYVVERRAEDGTSSRAVFDFAKALPGPPIRLEQKVGGTVRSTMTLLDSVVDRVIADS